MIEDVKQEAEKRMQGAVQALILDMSGYRTGRASTQLVERLNVEVYGTDVPLNQIASISIPEPQQIAIRPYDPRNITPIERAILKSELSLTPNNDGKMIRLNIPRLTEERRRDLIRLVHRRVEEARVAVRNVRRDALGSLKLLKESKKISEDSFYQSQEEMQTLTDLYIEEINSLGKKKEAEILEV